MAKKAFEKPESYSEVKDLAALSNLALDEYSELVKIADADLTDEQIDRMVELKQAMKDIKDEQAAQAIAATERAQRIADAKASDEDEADEDDDESDDEADEDEGDDDEEEAEDAEADADAEKEAILASARRKATARRATTKRRKPAVDEEAEAPKGREVQITAQADVRGFANSQSIDMDGAVEAFMNRLQGMPGGGTKKVGSQISAFGVATFTKTAEPAFADNTITDRMSAEDQWRNVMAASSAKGKDASILADGGWCAPSTNFYDLCQWETTNGALDLPEITVVRGGINFTKGPDFSDIYTNTGFLQTEAQAEAGTAKTFLEVDCPDWTDVRLDAIGYGVKAPILTASPAGFPELVRRYLEGALVAHWHKVNAYVISKVVTSLGSVQNFAEYGSASGDLLNAVEIAAQSLRYKYRLAPNETLEAMFPMWVHSAIRADVARRSGVELLAVTDQQINSWFSLRGIRPQFVYDWAGQDLVGTELQFPATVRFGIWRAGTFVKGTNSIIRLDAIYDSTEITTNNYTAAFFEEAILVANTCGQGRIFEVALNLHGRSGANDIGASTGS